jgi:nucleotide-binding universal stress UspA family protein
MIARRILVHVDLTDASLDAVRYARILAERLGASLRVVHVKQEPLSAGWTSEVSVARLPEVQQAMEEEAEQWLDQVLPQADRQRLDVRLDLETGDIADEVARYADQHHVDLVVLSASRREDADTTDTGIARDVLAKCRCSVLVVR